MNQSNFYNQNNRHRKNNNNSYCENTNCYNCYDCQPCTIYPPSNNCPDKSCTVCPTGPMGPTGQQGPAGPQGATGATGGVLNFADFYALMPPDNAATVAPRTDVSFPQDGPNSGSNIFRTGARSFNLSKIGSYQILFQVGVDEAGQLLLTLNDEPLEYTVVGRATGTSQIIGMAILTTTTINSTLTVRNPSDNSTALTITPSAGGTQPVSAHLVIIQIQ